MQNEFNAPILLYRRSLNNSPTRFGRSVANLEVLFKKYRVLHSKHTFPEFPLPLFYENFISNPQTWKILNANAWEKFIFTYLLQFPKKERSLSSKYFASADFLTAYLSYAVCQGSGAQSVADRVQVFTGD
jgi:hypothetical protein